MKNTCLFILLPVTITGVSQTMPAAAQEWQFPYQETVIHEQAARIHLVKKIIR